MSHTDAFCHFFFEGQMYNGYSVKDNITPETGCKAGDIMGRRDGIVTRAVLYDMPQLKGVDSIEPGTPITRADLEAWERKAGVKVGAGDVILLYVGRWKRRAVEGPPVLVVPGYPLSGLLGVSWIRPDDRNANGVIEPGEVLTAPVGFVGQTIPSRYATVGTHLALAGGRWRVAAQLSYRGGFVSANPTEIYRSLNAGNTRALNVKGVSLEEQARSAVYVDPTGAPPGDASFLRLREVSVSHRVAASVARWVGARALTLTLTGRNLATWTGYQGWDPEVQTIGAEFFRGGAGVSYGAAPFQPPIPRSVTLRLVLDW